MGPRPDIQVESASGARLAGRPTPDHL